MEDPGRVHLLLRLVYVNAMSFTQYSHFPGARTSPSTRGINGDRRVQYKARQKYLGLHTKALEDKLGRGQ